MAYIKWDEALSVKIRTIDDQHKRLFEMINDFYDNIKLKKSKEGMMEILTHLKEYTSYHFNNEEFYFKQYKYPDAENHIKEHKFFIDKIADIESRFIAGKLVLSLEITEFLKNWIKDHIQIIDKKYSDYLVSKGVK